MAVSTIKGVTKDSYTLAYGAGWTFERFGDVVYLNMYNFSSVPAGSFTVGTVPEAFRPSRSANWTVVPRTTSARPPIAVSVDTDGVVRCYNYGTALTGTTPFINLVSYRVD